MNPTSLQKLLYDACQGSVMGLSTLSKGLVERAGPDATAILLSELNSVQDTWEDTAGKKINNLVVPDITEHDINQLKWIICLLKSESRVFALYCEVQFSTISISFA